MEYDLTDPPPVGFVHERFGHKYECVEVQPYTRKDGQPSAVITWSSTCPDCGNPFSIKAALRMHSLNRRCKGCVRPHRAASPEARAAQREGGRRAAFEAKRRRAIKEMLS